LRITRSVDSAAVLGHVSAKIISPVQDGTCEIVVGHQFERGPGETEEKVSTITRSLFGS
jgi:hypothetical protein